LIGGSNAFTYLWSTGATSPSITVNQGGTYFVDVNSSDGCIGNKSFTVTTFNQPIIDEILVDFEKATILTLNQGNFLYSIDGINYVSTNVFYITNGGYYVAYVKDLNGCGIVTKPFVFLSIPAFFTPNGDGKNDVWKVEGLNFIGSARVTIYDKYGKLIADLNEKQAWNGTYNGHQLPSTDYWYVITMPQTNQIFKGHFSLKR
jgi:gliding motility-associated-like protein